MTVSEAHASLTSRIIAAQMQLRKGPRIKLWAFDSHQY